MKKNIILFLVIFSTNMFAVNLYENMTKAYKEHRVIKPIQTSKSGFKLSGLHYFAFDVIDDGNESKYKFKIKRNYFTLKKSINSQMYFKTTLDVYQNSDGVWDTNLKYAYLYIKNILPYTDVEVGQVHTTWIDYEKKSSWKYDLSSKVFVDDKHILSSADQGINLKTNMRYFSSEIGVFNGEGYKEKDDGKGLRIEGRFTYHLLGNSFKTDYLNVSVFVVDSNNDASNANKDFSMQGIHLVYKNRFAMLSAQSITTKKESESSKDGYSLSADLELQPNVHLFVMQSEFDDKSSSVGGLSRQINYNLKTVAMYKKSENLKEYLLGLELKW